MKGFFGLQDAKGLLRKLDHDFARLKETPNDQYKAFNFFVTADHMLDWLYPGNTRSQKSNRTACRKAELLLQIVNHLSSGAKHFSELDPRHDTVKDTQNVRRTPPHRYIGGRTKIIIWSTPRPVLQVELDGAAAAKYGSRIHVVDLAAKVHEYWLARLA